MSDPKKTRTMLARLLDLSGDRPAPDTLRCVLLGGAGADPALIERCRDQQVLFTCCPSTTLYTTPHKDLSAPDHPIRRMREAGLTVCINSDDPPMFLTDLGREYLKAMELLGFSATDLKRSIYATIDNAWVDDATKSRWRSDWTPEIERITAELDALG